MLGVPGQLLSSVMNEMLLVTCRPFVGRLFFGTSGTTTTHELAASTEKEYIE